LSLGVELVRCWYARSGWCRLLYPLSLLFRFLAWLRRRSYASGWRKVGRMPVPVIVVGNITVGGTGKTPLVLWLAERLRASGFRPGVVSRGHGARVATVREVDPAADPGVVGDEPVLIARRRLCPVWVGRDRASAAAGLLEAHPEVNVLIADDGLQHYALARDMEIVVVDGARMFGNGLCLPAGPLREVPARLAEADAVVVHGEWDGRPPPVPVYTMELRQRGFARLGGSGDSLLPGHFDGLPVHAVAGIGNPARFFAALAGQGVAAVPHAFPDHHRYRPGDLPDATVIMTEKDAVKCASFGHPDAWVAMVDAEVAAGLESQVLAKLKAHHGQ
jgi:tetraacyldisaccharide 4'-kinase